MDKFCQVYYAFQYSFQCLAASLACCMRFKSVLFEVSCKATAAAYEDTILHAKGERARGTQELKNTITSDHLRSGTQTTCVNSENSVEVVWHNPR